MSLIPFEPGPNQDYDTQLQEALERALSMHGTMLNDLEFAINTVLQYQRTFKMLCAPDPCEDAARYLTEKYKMARKEIDAINALPSGNKTIGELNA